jgi:5-oxoprolinase (ATP-hydrolysing) subunit A
VKINLNADLGESFGAWTMGDDAALLAVVGAANIACGFHAGDPLVMRRTVRTALAAGVGLGAHPAYPDLQGFGRRPMQMAPAELEAALIYQIGALAGIAAAEGGRLAHVKPHGALNNQACEDAALADTVARAVRAVDRELILLAPALSALIDAGERAGLRVAAEVFADRAYTDAGTLVPRREPGAVLHDDGEVQAHVMRMLDAGGIVAISGKVMRTPMHSICVHGDTPGAVANARRLRTGLEAAGWRLVGLAEAQAG